MQCLSFGWYIITVIMIMVITSVAASSLKSSEQGTKIVDVLSDVAFGAAAIWFIAGFFMKCDPPTLVSAVTSA
jgi:hypothetical protein